MPWDIWIVLMLLGGAVSGVFGWAVGRAQGRQKGELHAIMTPLPEPEDPPPKQLHVHTFRLRSVEYVNDERVDIYRCEDCREVERWVTGRKED